MRRGDMIQFKPPGAGLRIGMWTGTIEQVIEPEHLYNVRTFRGIVPVYHSDIAKSIWEREHVYPRK